MFAASSACAARFSYTLLNFFVSFVGPDNISPEALRANPDLTANILHKIYSDI
jgi:hypothetical protein